MIKTYISDKYAINIFEFLKDMCDCIILFIGELHDSKQINILTDNNDNNDNNNNCVYWSYSYKKQVY